MTTHRVANGLLAAGLGKGSKAAVYSPNHASAYAALLGIVRAGITWAPVNARNALDENLYILGNTDVEFLFYHSSFESVLRAMYNAGFRGDVFPAPAHWRFGNVGVFPSYPFPEGIEEMRKGSS